MIFSQPQATYSTDQDRTKVSIKPLSYKIRHVYSRADYTTTSWSCLSCMYVWWCCVAADRRELWSARQEQCQSSAVTRSPGTCALLAREYFSRLAVKHANVCIRVCEQYTIAITCLVLSSGKTLLLFP